MATEAFARPSPLVQTEWLAAHLDDPAIRIIEVDEDPAVYAQGHIPGAVLWDWRTDMHEPFRRDFADRDALAELLGRSGVDHATTVVLYGDDHNWFAAYAYWLLRHRGFDAVRLLSGGRRKWMLDGLPWSTDIPVVQPGAGRIVGSERRQLRAFRSDVLGRLGDACFVDVRTPEEYRGESLGPPGTPREHAVVPGHIPGAVNIPWELTVNEDGTFRSYDELCALYERAGITADRVVITYCRIGERSAHTWFVLHELLGYPSVANYDGSWAEYGSLVGVPVARATPDRRTDRALI